MKTSLSIERWIKVANLVRPRVELPVPEVVAQNWHPAGTWGLAGKPNPSQFEESEAPVALEKLWRVPEALEKLWREVLEDLWRQWQEQFGKSEQEQSLGEIQHLLEARIGRRRAKEIAKTFEQRQRAASLEVEVSFLEKRGRGRPRKGEQVGVVNRREEWRPRDQLQLYRLLFYPIRKCLDAIADSHLAAAGAPGRIVHIPSAEEMFIAPDGSVFVLRGILGQFHKALVRTDPARIRRCPICSRIYYAWRRDKSACSPRCCDTYNARKQNAVRRRQYEENRQINQLVGGRNPLSSRIPLNKAKAELQKKREKQQRKSQ